MATLFEECLEAIGNDKEILSKQESNNVFQSLISKFQFTEWGVIDWQKVKNRFMVNKIDDIDFVLKNNIVEHQYFVYLIWNDGDIPVIKTKLQIALNSIDDVTAVSFDTWMLSVDGKYVIEFHHEGRISIGIL